MTTKALVDYYDTPHTYTFTHKSVWLNVMHFIWIILNFFLNLLNRLLLKVNKKGINIFTKTVTHLKAKKHCWVSKRKVPKITKIRSTILFFIKLNRVLIYRLQKNCLCQIAICSAPFVQKLIISTTFPINTHMYKIST